MRMSTSPSPACGIGLSTSSKLSRPGAPSGRDFNRIWRFILSGIGISKLSLMHHKIVDNQVCKPGDDEGDSIRVETALITPRLPYPASLPSSTGPRRALEDSSHAQTLVLPRAARSLPAWLYLGGASMFCRCCRRADCPDNSRA